MKKTSDLSIDTELTCKILTGFIQTEITRAGFSKAVVGLSGGIDSSLSCYLAAEALGTENVLAVLMPYESSSPGSLDHARLVIDELGPLEFLRGEGWMAGFEAVNSGEYRVALLVIRPSLLKEALSRWQVSRIINLDDPDDLFLSGTDLLAALMELPG